MKKSGKIISLLPAALPVFSMAACGSSVSTVFLLLQTVRT